MINQETVQMELQRIDICDLELAWLAAKELANDEGKKWDRLHSKLKDILEKFDKEYYEKKDKEGE